MEEYYRNFFDKKKVLITGDTGFKGTWLALWLSKLGAYVTGISLAPGDQNRFYSSINKNDSIWDHIDCDIKRYSSVNEVLQEKRPDIVFHLAAQSLVTLSYLDPIETYHTNVLGSVHVLEAVRNCPSVEGIIYVTSDKCYKNKNWAWGYRENDDLGGNDPYSASKAAAELVLESYRNTLFIERDIGLASVRAGNVIGGGDWSENRLIPDCIRAASTDEQVDLRYPDATRPWQHVLEPLSGYMKLAVELTKNKSFSGAWNFGPSMTATRPVIEVVKEVKKHFPELSFSAREDKLPHEEMMLSVSSEKSRNFLNWQTVWGFSKAVSKTCLWYKENLDCESKAVSITYRQIEEYMEDGLID